MKLWVISQDRNNGYDTYDSAVVAAETEEEAKGIYPNTYPSKFSKDNGWYSKDFFGETRYYESWEWCLPDEVKVEYLGETDRKISGVILASFNAG